MQCSGGSSRFGNESSGAIKVEYFLISLTTVSFSKRFLFHQVSCGCPSRFSCIIGCVLQRVLRSYLTLLANRKLGCSSSCLLEVVKPMICQANRTGVPHATSTSSSHHICVIRLATGIVHRCFIMHFHSLVYVTELRLFTT
jgi:hypothetical protein